MNKIETIPYISNGISSDVGKTDVWCVISINQKVMKIDRLKCHDVFDLILIFHDVKKVNRINYIRVSFLAARWCHYKIFILKCFEDNLYRISLL